VAGPWQRQGSDKISIRETRVRSQQGTTEPLAFEGEAGDWQVNKEEGKTRTNTPKGSKCIGCKGRVKTGCPRSLWPEVRGQMAGDTIGKVIETSEDWQVTEAEFYSAGHLIACGTDLRVTRRSLQNLGGPSSEGQGGASKR
jgi:hypothetical protein